MARPVLLIVGGDATPLSPQWISSPPYLWLTERGWWKDRETQGEETAAGIGDAWLLMRRMNSWGTLGEDEDADVL